MGVSAQELNVHYLRTTSVVDYTLIGVLVPLGVAIMGSVGVAAWWLYHRVHLREEVFGDMEAGELQRDYQDMH